MTNPDTRPQTGREQGELSPINLNVAVLISNKGKGSNLKALIDASREGALPNVDLGLVISDRADALGLDIAREFEIPDYVRPFRKKQFKDEGAIAAGRDEYSATLAFMLNREGVNVAVMAGFNTILSRSYFGMFDGVTINVHPGYVPDDPALRRMYWDGSDIPWNQGLAFEEAVENFVGKPRAFSTVHIATPTVDFGPVLKRAWVDVVKGETASEIYARLKGEEHEALIEALNGQKLRGHVQAKK